MDRPAGRLTYTPTSLEDFWGRRRLQPTERTEVKIFGHSLGVDTNHRGVLDAVALASRSYTTAAASEPRFSMQIAVDETLPSDLDPSGHLPGDIHYSGSRDWLSIGLGPWGRAHVDLSTGEAVLVIAPSLAAEPALLARWVIHTVWTNFLIRSGYGMLHATALHRDGALACIVGPHNSGKSAAALLLALRGDWCLLSDSLVFFDEAGQPFRFNAFPAGRIGVRRDTLDRWPALVPFATPQPIRGEEKYDVDLMAAAPQNVQLEAVGPDRVLLLLIDRRHSAGTTTRPVDPETAGSALVANSLFFDTDEVWSGNLLRLERLVAAAELHRLTAGTDGAQFIAAVDRLAAR
jgi:hypothetical protein